jgi:hypothetical protein
MSLVNIYTAWLIVMNGRQRNVTNAQIWGKYNHSNYDGICTSRDCLGGTYEISGRLIFVEQSVHVSSNILLILRSNCINTASGIVTVSK